MVDSAPLRRGLVDAQSQRTFGWGRGPIPRRKCQNYAALDLGTNNCRLLIARPNEDHFTVIDSFSRIVRLGEGVAATGILSEEAMSRTIEALCICAEKLSRRDVQLSRAVATEACRVARNGPEFIARVYRETGVHIEVISGEEEAQLAVTGCYSLLPQSAEPALIFDIGGGSTELVFVDTSSALPRILSWRSLPWGVVNLTEVSSKADGPPESLARAYDEMRTRVRASIGAFAKDSGHIKPRHLLGTSGTVTTLGGVFLGLETYDRRRVDGLNVPVAAMHDISQRLAGMNFAERADVSSIGLERADLVVAGCAILEEIMQLWPAKEMFIADRGIREGILLKLMTRKSI